MKLSWNTCTMLAICFVFMVINTQVSAQDTSTPIPLNFNHTFAAGFDENIVIWRSRLDRNLTIITGEVGGIVSWTVDDPSVLVLSPEMNGQLRINASTSLPLDVRVIIGGKFPGRKHLIVTYTPPGGIATEVGRHEVSCIVGQAFLNRFASYVFIVWLIISYVTMGCKMDVKVIKAKLNPPWAVLIGMFCQFLIMPALAYGIARIFELDQATAVGLILVGTCPGGWISNVMTVLFDCDFVLSLTMTSLSTILAMGMMPLNLLIYVQIIIGVDENLQTPWVELFVQLLLLIVPLGVGVLLAMKWPSLHERAEKLLKPFATILVLIALGFGVPTQIYTFYVDWKGWVVSLLLPFFGAFFGLAIARIIAQDYKTSATIAFETACQNALLAKTMANLFYPKPESDLIGILPLLVAVLTAFEGITAAIIYTCYKKIRDRRRENQETADERVTMTKFEKSEPEVNGNVNTDKEAEAKMGTPNPAFSA